MRPSRTPTSARRPGAPVPSITSPLRMTRSSGVTPRRLLLEREEQRGEALLAADARALEEVHRVRALHRAAGLLVCGEVATLLERDERGVVVVARRVGEVPYVGAGPRAKAVTRAAPIVVIA